jgi:hypothetical protein
MSPETERQAEVKEWLAKVILDLRGARIDLDARPPLPEDALFHCQQAVEKHDKPFRKTEELGRACCTLDSGLTTLVDEAVPLTGYAWAFRYPGAAPAPTLDEAHSALDLATRIARAIGARLPAEMVPEGYGPSSQ